LICFAFHLSAFIQPDLTGFAGWQWAPKLTSLKRSRRQDRQRGFRHELTPLTEATLPQRLHQSTNLAAGCG